MLAARSDEDLRKRVTAMLEAQEVIGAEELVTLFQDLGGSQETMAQLVQVSVALINGLAIKRFTATSYFDYRASVNLLKKLWRSELGLE